MKNRVVLAAVLLSIWGFETVEGQSALEKEVTGLRQKVQELEKLVHDLLSRSAGAARADSEPAAAQAPRPAPRDPNTLRVYWNEGIRMDSADRAFRLRIGGRIMNDWSFVRGSDSLEASSVGPLVNGTEFRRARVYFGGLIRDRMEFKAQYDFADTPVGFKDVYMGLRRIPGLGSLRVGHFKEPFSLEELTSSRYITFLERSLVNSMTPSRNAGIMLFNNALERRLTWALGVFRDSAGEGTAVGNGNFNTTARVTGLPWAREGDSRLLHLGLGYRHSNPQNGQLVFRARPEAHLLPRFVSATVNGVTSEERLALEAALVHGPLSVQGEYLHSSTDAVTGPEPDFSSYYVQGSFFFTGEHRRYSRSSAAFSRVRPKADLFSGERGWGAWELAARYSSLDLEEASGGRLDTFTLGLNWYLNPNSRVMWNWVNGDRESAGDADILQMRFQVDF